MKKISSIIAKNVTVMQSACTIQQNVNVVSFYDLDMHQLPHSVLFIYFFFLTKHEHSHMSLLQHTLIHKPAYMLRNPAFHLELRHTKIV